MRASGACGDCNALGANHALGTPILRDLRIIGGEDESLNHGRTRRVADGIHLH